MRKKSKADLTKDLQEGKNLAVVPQTRGELVQVRAKQLEAGEISAWSFAQELKLTEKQFKFCEIYASAEFLGNATQAACKAYDLDYENPAECKNATAYAVKNLKHVGVQTLINSLIQSQGLNEQAANKSLLFMMTQFSDMKVKFLATKLFFEMDGRLKKEQSLTIKHHYDFDSLSEDKLRALRETLMIAAGNIIPAITKNEIIDITPIENADEDEIEEED